jgi:phosphatidylglycerophosphatase C
MKRVIARIFADGDGSLAASLFSSGRGRSDAAREAFMSHVDVPTITLPRECCISSEDLVVRLAEARAAVDHPRLNIWGFGSPTAPCAPNPNVMLAFDADGTLWSGDVGNDLFHALIDAQAVRKAAYGALVREAEAYGLAYSENAVEVAQMLFQACEAGQYPEDRCFAMMAWVFAGFTLQDTVAFSRDVARETNLEARLHRFLDPIFDWARNENVPVWVVSASPKWMVEIGAAMFGIPNDQVIGMTPVIKNGTILPELDGLPIYGPNKPLMLREMCPRGSLLGGFGDSSYDVPLLKMAHVPVAVRPKQGLVACLRDVPNLVAIGL